MWKRHLALITVTGLTSGIRGQGCDPADIFTAPSSYTAGNAPRSVSLGDLDGDDDLDMALASIGNNAARVLLNQYTGGPCNPADFDGNGLLDLADITAFIEAFVAGCP